MRIHVIQHAPFEGPGTIADWARSRHHELATSLAFTEEFPDAVDIDFLVLMGGPMAADDDAGNPWLLREKRFVAETIAAGRLVLGVCLGSQIVAEVLGGRVRRNLNKEIGWYAVEPTDQTAASTIFSAWDGPVVVGQWHGDTFELPPAMEPLLSSEACANQAFVFDGRVVGVQFHLEWTPELLEQLIAACRAELEQDGLYVTAAEQILDEAPERLAVCRERLFALLDVMAEQGPGIAGEGRP